VEAVKVAKPKAWTPVEITEFGCTARGITQDTGRKFGYGYGTDSAGTKVHVANYYDDQGQLCGQKLRYPNKEFKVLGTVSKRFFGGNLWPATGRKICITEGELDALSLSQVQQNKWPVVSIPNGADSAVATLKANLSMLEGYDQVVLMFDNDEPGKAAAVKAAEVLTPGKACIAVLPEKDANDMLLKGKSVQLVEAMWSAKVYRPDGVVSGEAVWEKVAVEDKRLSVAYPWEGLTRLTHGMRMGELVTFTAGTGVGKSLICRTLAHDLLRRGYKVGYIALEESVRRSVLGILSIEMQRPLHLTDFKPEELRPAFDKLMGEERFFAYDHFGSVDSTNLLNRIRYLQKACGCQWIVLDHLSIVVSGLDPGEDERRSIDRTMTLLRSMVEETGMGLFVVSHLRRVGEGPAHENGSEVSLSHLRGSQSIAQLSDMVIALERNQQSDDERNFTTVRVLKNRYSGDTGIACTLKYDPVTGTVAECHHVAKPKKQKDKRATAKDHGFTHQSF
jgi:twinkle protein